MPLWAQILLKLLDNQAFVEGLFGLIEKLFTTNPSLAADLLAAWTKGNAAVGK